MAVCTAPNWRRLFTSRSDWNTKTVAIVNACLLRRMTGVNFAVVSATLAVNLLFFFSCRLKLQSKLIPGSHFVFALFAHRLIGELGRTVTAQLSCLQPQLEKLAASYTLYQHCSCLSMFSLAKYDAIRWPRGYSKEQRPMSEEIQMNGGEDID